MRGRAVAPSLSGTRQPKGRSHGTPPEDAAVSLRGQFFARVYDPMMSWPEAAGLRAHRRQLLTMASGRVLEIGCGTGANLPFYSDAVEELTVTEPERAMLRRLRGRVREHAPRARLLRAPAEDLPFEKGSFDVAVSTLVLCTVDDLPRALRELRRVLRPGGRLLFIEHVRSELPGLARWQDRLNGVNRIIGHGCNCNRPTLDCLRATGFMVGHLERDTLRRVPPLVRPLVVGTAEVRKDEANAS
jgi:ubiquinone/menaquinone biosynthesis C-methylase UbiE